MISYAGLPMETREINLVFHGHLVDDVFGPYVALPTEREVIITLAHGQTWRSISRRSYTRGSSIDFYINDAHFIGHVRFRRLNRMVCVGRFEETGSRIGSSPA